MISRLIIASLVPAALVAAASFGVASAQYPPPVGNCVVTASATTVQAGGGNVDIKVTVRDLDGVPVAGESVSFSIVGQPGSGVATATLSTAAAAGVVEVVASAEDVSCRTSVVVPAGQVAPTVELPDTGSGPAGHGAILAEIALALVLGGIVLAVAGAKRRSA